MIKGSPSFASNIAFTSGNRISNRKGIGIEIGEIGIGKNRNRNRQE